MSGAGLNEITIGGERYLLVEVGGGAAVHLARADAAGRGAVAEHHLDASQPGYQTSIRKYVAAALLRPEWCATTLCGRTWSLMTASTEEPLAMYQEPAFAPSCRSCQRLLDRQFREPSPDEALQLVVELACEAVLEHGSAQINGVPGDQASLLRKAVATRVKAAGYGVRTHLLDDTVLISSDQPISQERARETADVIARAFDVDGGHPVARPEWIIEWSTWLTS